MGEQENAVAVHVSPLWPFVRKQGRALSVNSGALLFAEGEEADAVYFIDSGRVRLEVSSGGRSYAYQECYPGDLVGLDAVFSGKPHNATARVADDAIVHFTPKAEFLRFINANPEAFVTTLQLLSNAVVDSKHSLKSIGT